MIKPRTEKVMLWIVAFGLVVSAVAFAAVVLLEIGGK
jgi:hypothetical protein